MKNWFFLIVTIAFVSLPSLAESAAKKARDFSCTDYCTAEGKYAVNTIKHELATKNVISDDDKRQKRFEDACLLTHKLVDGNVFGCKAPENKCLEEGGLLSKFKGRKAKVEDYIIKLWDECDKAKDLFGVRSIE